MDHWVAECRPCKWQELHDKQDDAIGAAEEHVYTHHPKVPPHERMLNGIGHVQNRTDNAVGTAPVVPEQLETPAAESAPTNDLVLTSGEETTPEHEG